MARLFDETTKRWTDPPYGVACQSQTDFVWPSVSTKSGDLGSIPCAMRGNGGINSYGEVEQVPVEALVLASEWILGTHITGLTVRGAPVQRGAGSPLGVIVQTSSAAVFIAGSAMEMDLPNPERYKKGKEKVSVLIIGFYCSRKFFSDDGAIFHVSLVSALLHLCDTHAGDSTGKLEEDSSSQT